MSGFNRVGGADALPVLRLKLIEGHHFFPILLQCPDTWTQESSPSAGRCRSGCHTRVDSRFEQRRFGHLRLSLRALPASWGEWIDQSSVSQALRTPWALPEDTNHVRQL